MTTAAVVAFYQEDSKLYLSYAGHPPTYVRSGAAGGWHAVQLGPGEKWGSLPLGVLEDTPYDQQSVTLESGDGILIYTDGVTETPDQNKRLFGEERLLSALESADGATPNDLKQHIVSELRAFASGSLDHDDVTLLAIQVN
jgi:phosphoserine phosphatase RsbU/P